jgi:DNA repair ATPase RecN
MDERLKRLTELARMAFGDAAMVASRDMDEVEVYDDSQRWYVTITGHPRALDALEAALTVLSQCEDGSDGKSAKPTTLQRCWETIEHMDREVQGAMNDRAETRKCAEAAEKRVMELERRLQAIRGVAATWSMGDCDAQDLHDAVMDDLTGEP